MNLTVFGLSSVARTYCCTVLESQVQELYVMLHVLVIWKQDVISLLFITSFGRIIIIILPTECDSRVVLSHPVPANSLTHGRAKARPWLSLLLSFLWSNIILITWHDLRSPGPHVSLLVTTHHTFTLFVIFNHTEMYFMVIQKCTLKYILARLSDTWDLSQSSNMSTS